MQLTTKKVGKIIRKIRKSQGLTQTQLALACNVGLRFISDLENGKDSCQIGKSLYVLQMLGVKIDLNFPDES